MGNWSCFEHPHEVWVQHTYDVNEKPKRVSVIKKRGIQSGFDSPPPPLYDQYPVAIKKAKAEGLKKLVTKYVPAAHRVFYSELHIVDTYDDTDSDGDYGSLLLHILYIHIYCHACLICW